MSILEWNGASMAMNKVLLISFFWLVASILFVSGTVCGEEPDYEEGFYVVQPTSEDDAEEQASKQDEDTDEDAEDTEDSESGPKAIVPNSYVKSEVDRQLKGTGLEFSPYSPGEVWPTESYDSNYDSNNEEYSQEEYPQVEPIVLMPDEDKEQGEENETEEGEDDNE